MYMYYGLFDTHSQKEESSNIKKDEEFSDVPVY